TTMCWCVWTLVRDTPVTRPPAWQRDGCPCERERRGRMTPETAYDLDITPEYTLLLAIIRRAHEALRDHAPPHARASSIQRFSNQSRHFELLCSLMDLDYEGMQEAVWRQYQQVPRSPRRNVLP